MRRITTRAELVELARELGVRPDWHEPDEQRITAVVEGTHMNFDNAFPAGHRYGPDSEQRTELHVILYRTVWEVGSFVQRSGEQREGRWVLGQPIAVVNLATLFAWASGFDESTVELYQDLERRQDETIRRVVRQYFSESDPMDDSTAFSLIAELARELPRVPRALSYYQEMLATERVSTLNSWAVKFAKQHDESPVGPQKILAMALSDAFRQAAKHEKALHESKKRHPSGRVPKYGTHD